MNYFVVLFFGILSEFFVFMILVLISKKEIIFNSKYKYTLTYSFLVLILINILTHVVMVFILPNLVTLGYLNYLILIEILILIVEGLLLYYLFFKKFNLYLTFGISFFMNLFSWQFYPFFMLVIIKLFNI